VIKHILSLFYFIIPNLLTAQDSFTIYGKIEMISKSDSIILKSAWGTFTTKIKNDGSFFISGNGIKTSSDALILTDSSGANSIWLEPGEYHIECKEIKPDFSSRPIFLIPKLAGPKDAEIIHGYQKQMMEFNLFVPREKRKEVALSFIIIYIDSIFEYFPSSKALPNLLGSATPIIGDDAAKHYYSFLSNEQMAQPGGGEQLTNYFKRKEKIENEKYFQDFEMKDQSGNIFKLSSVNKKLILLDFWSSDCGPCRRKHPKLAELYKKYANKGFEIVSVSFDDTKEDWLKAIAKDKMIWINVSELKGWKTSLSEDYFIKSIPFAIWLDKGKKIISTTDLSEAQIEEYLK